MELLKLLPREVLIILASALVGSTCVALGILATAAAERLRRRD